MRVASGSVHVFRFRLDPPAAEVGELERLLAADELAQAERLVSMAGRRRAVVARGRLRTILAACLDADPRDLLFRYGEYGKPELPDSDLRFNLAHSDDLALLALASGREVGVDVESERLEVSVDEVADHIFAPGERARLSELPAGERRRAFFDLWACKEAYVKATGAGFSRSPSSFEIDVRPEYPELVTVDGEPPSDEWWSFARLDSGAGYAAAIAFEGNRSEIRLEDWPTWPLRRARPRAA